MPFLSYQSCACFLLKAVQMSTKIDFNIASKANSATLKEDIELYLKKQQKMDKLAKVDCRMMILDYLTVCQYQNWEFDGSYNTAVEAIVKYLRLREYNGFIQVQLNCHISAIRNYYNYMSRFGVKNPANDAKILQIYKNVQSLYDTVGQSTQKQAIQTDDSTNSVLLITDENKEPKAQVPLNLRAKRAYKKRIPKPFVKRIMQRRLTRSKSEIQEIHSSDSTVYANKSESTDLPQPTAFTIYLKNLNTSDEDCALYDELLLKYLTGCLDLCINPKSTYSKTVSGIIKYFKSRSRDNVVTFPLFNKMMFEKSVISKYYDMLGMTGNENPTNDERVEKELLRLSQQGIKKAGKSRITPRSNKLNNKQISILDIIEVGCSPDGLDNGVVQAIKFHDKSAPKDISQDDTFTNLFEGSNCSGLTMTNDVGISAPFKSDEEIQDYLKQMDIAPISRYIYTTVFDAFLRGCDMLDLNPNLPYEQAVQVLIKYFSVKVQQRQISFHSLIQENNIIAKYYEMMSRASNNNPARDERIILAFKQFELVPTIVKVDYELLELEAVLELAICKNDKFTKIDKFVNSGDYGAVIQMMES